MIGTLNKIILKCLELLEINKDDYFIIKTILNRYLNKNEKKYEIKECKEKRSLNANNYYWQLVTKLGNVLRIDKEDLHFKLLQRYGQCEMISVLAEIDMKDYLKYYIEAGESILNGKLFKHYKVYKGSSEMDSKEMSILIHGLVDECQTQGIETKTPEEINSLLKEWGK